MPNTKEALQILLVLLPGFVSLRVMSYFTPTKSLTAIGEVITAAVFCGVDFTFYKLIEYAVFRPFSNKGLFQLKDLLSIEHGFSFRYLGCMTFLFLISFWDGFRWAIILNNKGVCKILDRYKAKI